MKKIQKLPAPASAARVETGAVQFGDDWPGLFIRGDDCMVLAATIERFFASLVQDYRPALGSDISLGPLTQLLHHINKDVVVGRRKQKEYERAKDQPKKGSK